jgi:hypothetical protein
MNVLTLSCFYKESIWTLVRRVRFKSRLESTPLRMPTDWRNLPVEQMIGAALSSSPATMFERLLSASQSSLDDLQ